MAFPERFLDELLARTDMIALVGRYVPLRRTGADYVGRCPFHSEKTPSFHVTPDRGLFYCFGCHAGGGAIGFVQRIENLDYPEAVRLLAERAGLEVPQEDDLPGPRVSRQRLLDVNRRAARWFYDNLSRPEGRAAVAYMGRRGILPGAARRWGLGCAPDSWDGLLHALAAQSFSQEEMRAAGLITAGQRGSMYDAFRNRLMFPIFDIRGQVVAFSGRALDDSSAKYKNSPETPLYSKRGLLFGAHLAKSSRRPGWILVEGNMDVFMLHQAGFDNAVATCGTALTDTQARLAARYTKDIFLCYDGDAAGQAATQKAIDILDGAGLRVKVLRLGGAKDPDEFILRYGAPAFENLMSGAEGHMDYRLARLAENHDLSGGPGKIAYLRAAAAMLAAMPGRAEREIYAERVAQTAGVQKAAVLADVEKLSAKALRKAGQKNRYDLPRPPRGEFDRTEELALALLLRRPELLDEGRPAEEDFSEPALRALYRALREGRAGPGGGLEPDLLAKLAKLDIMALSLPPGDGREALADCAERMEGRSALRQAASEGKDDLEAKYERLKDAKRYGG